MLVMDSDGNIFDERRKSQRRKDQNGNVPEDRRKEDRRKKDINANPRKK